MRIERTFNFDLVKVILTHPEIYPYMVSDGAAKPEDLIVDTSSFPYYLLVFDERDMLQGMFIAVPFRNTAITWEIHTCLLPNCRGKKALEAYEAGMDWLRGNTACRRVMGNICADNKRALRIAQMCGNRIIGINEKSILKGGVLMDQYIVGRSL